MRNIHRLLLVASAIVAAAVPALAQGPGEAALTQFFEGKSVRVRIDMPASSQGIDVFPDAQRPINFDDYSRRVKSNGIAVRTGDSVIVTKVRVKEKLIEFQLAGGGYGTFGDDTGSVYTPPTPKSNREKDLEKLIKNEKDAARKRSLERELDDLEARRAREDLRNNAAAAAATEVKKARIAETRLHSGSRFNIRYQNGVPPGLGPDGVMRALAEYVEFPFATDRRPTAPAARELAASPEPRGLVTGSGAIRKGMTLAEVEQSLGRAERTTDRMEGALKVVTATYTRDDQRITAEFVEGVLNQVFDRVEVARREARGAGSKREVRQVMANDEGADADRWEQLNKCPDCGKDMERLAQVGEQVGLYYRCAEHGEFRYSWDDDALQRVPEKPA